MQGYVKRMIVEERELRRKITRLARYVHECGEHDISGEELLLLGEQLNHMVCYDKILLRRIDKHMIHR